MKKELTRPEKHSPLTVLVFRVWYLDGGQRKSKFINAPTKSLMERKLNRIKGEVFRVDEFEQTRSITAY
jgi:hypothetical protein